MESPKVYTNGVNTYNKLHDEKPQITSQNFNFDGESFSEMMDKEEAAGGGLRETARELAEDESILSTDEENRAMVRRGQQQQEEAQKPHFEGPEDKARLLKLMDMSNKINLSNINISKSKKEIENTLGSANEEVQEEEDISSVIAKLSAQKEKESDLQDENIETEIAMDKDSDEFEDKRKDNSQVLHETEEELREDLSILSTEEENLEMARRNAAMNSLSDNDYKTSQDDMMFMNDLVALNNQMHVEKSNVVETTQNVLSALVSQTKSLDNTNRMNLSELSASDVDCIIGLLRRGTSSSSNFTDESNDELHILSEKFLALLRDSIVNKKVFRIDFDNQISVIIKIDREGKLSAEFLTNDDAIETYLKNNLHLLKERFEELNVDYNELTYRNTNKEN